MEPTATNLADSGYWDKGYGDFVLSPMPENYSTVKMLYQYLGRPGMGNGRSVFEIGVYPGRFIYHFGKAGYTLNGIDQTKYLPAMVNWLQKNNFQTNFFSQEDVMKISKEVKYDVVFSAGFIEHFVEFEDMVQLHADLTKPGGYVFITAPNFGGSIQHWLHNYLDKENLDRHYVPSMDVDKWKTILLKNDFEIIQSGYIGHFDFWVDGQERNVGQRFLLKTVKLLLPVLKKLKLPNRRAYSPECVILARKKN